MWIFGSYLDRVGTRTNAMREFPFDTSVTDKELYFKGYGAGIKSAAKLTALCQAHGLFTLETANKFTTSANFVFDTAVYTDKTGEASPGTN